MADDPFYGFNNGATHIRVGRESEPRFYQFEGPLIRLMTDEDYKVLVHGDQRGYLESRADGTVEPASIWVHRFYDYSAGNFGRTPERFDLERAAVRLYDFVQLVRRKTGAPKVYLVAHSMGGLVARCMIEKVSRSRDGAGEPRQPGRDLVDRLFTYGTPHGGIAFDIGGGLLDWAMENFGPSGSEIFAPHNMYRYLTPGTSPDDHAPADWRPNQIPAEAFDVRRVFCLIGTDAADYGLPEKAVGPRSDGLVQIDNAYVRGAPRAYVHRAHTGRYGLVNSEEGYQNLRRFLFGSYQAGVELRGVTLAHQMGGPRVWQADVRLAQRGLPILMNEQAAAHYCPIQLDQELTQHAPDPGQPVHLTTVFLLDPERFRDSPEEKSPPRRRYAVTLRIYHLIEEHGTFFWQHHLEQIADWEDTLIVDVGRRDDEPETALRAWAAWNSSVAGPIDAFDPIMLEDRPFTADGDRLYCEIDVPQIAHPILGDRARVRLTVIRRD